MNRDRLQWRRLWDGLRVLMPWRHSPQKSARHRERRTPWDIPLITPGDAVPQSQLVERAERLRSAADEAARLAQTLYISFLLLGTYMAVIIGSTTDVQLLKVSPVTLPLLNVQLPIVGFYVVVPWLLLLFYFNLLLHLTFLAQKLHRFQAVVETVTDEATRVDQHARLFPFPFSLMLIGQSAQWRLRGLLGLMVMTTVVLVPLLLLLWAQVRFLPYHDPAITWNHRVAVLVDLVLLWLFWPLMLPPVPCTPSAAPSRRWWRLRQRPASARRLRWGAGLGCVTLVTMVFSLGIAVLPGEGLERWLAAHVFDSWRYVDRHAQGHALVLPTFWLFERYSAPFHRTLQLREQVLLAGDPPAEVIAALRSQEETKRAQGLDKITGLNLYGRDLRGADLSDTLLPKADLRFAKLQGARLSRARVFASNLYGAQLHGGDLAHAWLHGATLGAQLDGAFLFGAQLPGADFMNTSLRGASLANAVLHGANLQRAELQGVDLRGAQLQEADLRGARLQGAFLEFARLQGADLRGAQLQGADLRRTQLQGANLRGARLQGADLANAQLQGANLENAQLQGADLRGTQLQGSNLRGADVGSVDFYDANLTWSDLRGLAQSPLDRQTYEELGEILIDPLRGLSPWEVQTFGGLDDNVDPRLDSRERVVSRERIQAAMGRSTNLSAARAQEHSVLCDQGERVPFCVTQVPSAEEASARAVFLETLGCEGKDAAIARGITTWHRLQLQVSAQKDPMLLAFVQYITTRPEKDCPGWAALPAAETDALRKLAADNTSAP